MCYDFKIIKYKKKKHNFKTNNHHCILAIDDNYIIMIDHSLEKHQILCF